jgi:hypothetical protein
MVTFAHNIIYISTVIFGAFLVVIGLYGFIMVLLRKWPIGMAFATLAAAVFGGALVIWASKDFTGDKLLIDTIGTWAKTFLTEEMAP